MPRLRPSADAGRPRSGPVKSAHAGVYGRVWHTDIQIECGIGWHNSTGPAEAQKGAEGPHGVGGLTIHRRLRRLKAGIGA